MGEPNAVQKKEYPPINPDDFGEEDTPKSNVEPLEEPFGMVSVDTLVSGFTGPGDVKIRFSSILYTPLRIRTPLIEFPFGFRFVPTFQGELDLKGEDVVVGAGIETQWGLDPLLHAYLRNSALCVFEEKTLDWQMEGGLRAPVLFYDGPVQFGLELGGGGRPLLGERNGYFSLGLTTNY